MLGRALRRVRTKPSQARPVVPIMDLNSTRTTIYEGREVQPVLPGRFV
jgi:hypothetical protein